MNVLTKEQREAIEFVKTIDGYFEQGYALAPIIYELSGADIPTYLKTLLAAQQWPDANDAINYQRDLGAVKWCLEQLRVL